MSKEELEKLNNRVRFLELKSEIDFIAKQIGADSAKLHYETQYVEFYLKNALFHPNAGGEAVSYYTDKYIRSLQLSEIRDYYNFTKLIVENKGDKDA